MEVTHNDNSNTRNYFRYGNKFMLLLWKLGLADWINLWPTIFGQYMVITHVGRKTGYKRLTPLNYAVIDGEVYCTAAWGAKADWYRNILAHEHVEIWLTEGRWEGEARDISQHPDRVKILREVLLASGFAAPLFGLHPKTMDDATLKQLTSDYKLVHISRIDQRTGRDGPGELAWIWPLVAAFLLLWGFRRRKS